MKNAIRSAFKKCFPVITLLLSMTGFYAQAQNDRFILKMAGFETGFTSEITFDIDLKANMVLVEKLTDDDKVSKEYYIIKKVARYGTDTAAFAGFIFEDAVENKYNVCLLGKDRVIFENSEAGENRQEYRGYITDMNVFEALIKTIKPKEPANTPAKNQNIVFSFETKSVKNTALTATVRVDLKNKKMFTDIFENGTPLGTIEYPIKEAQTYGDGATGSVSFTLGYNAQGFDKCEIIKGDPGKGQAYPKNTVRFTGYNAGTKTHSTLDLVFSDPKDFVALFTSVQTENLIRK